MQSSGIVKCLSKLNKRNIYFHFQLIFFGSVDSADYWSFVQWAGTMELRLFGLTGRSGISPSWTNRNLTAPSTALHWGAPRTGNILDVKRKCTHYVQESGARSKLIKLAISRIAFFFSFQLTSKSIDKNVDINTHIMIYFVHSLKIKETINIVLQVICLLNFIYV